MNEEQADTRQTQIIPRWGILGTGRIAHDFVTALTVLEQLASVVAVGSRNVESSKKFAQEHSIPRAHGSYEELVNDSDVEIIYVATPNSHHKEHALMALNAGKSVLCEKSFTLNEKEAQQVVEAARKNNVFLMEANWMPFFPMFRKMSQLIKDDVIGDVHFLQADLGFQNNHTLNPGIINPDIGGGALLACGVYPITLASFVFGDTPKSISAFAKMNEQTGVDETVSVILTYENGKMANLSTSIIANLNSEALIIGTKGKIKLHGMCCCPLKLTLSVNGEQDVHFSETLPECQPFDAFHFPNSEGLFYEAEEVIACLQAGRTESEIMPLSKTLANMRTMDIIRDQIGLRYPQEALN